MNMWVRNLVMLTAIIGLSVGSAQPGFTAAGAPPDGPIDAVETGADLKLACGQEVDGFEDVVGEKTYRSMLIVQCRAVVGTIAGMIKAGQFAIKDAPKWQCVTIPEDLGELSATFVSWVGRKPALMRKPAAVAFIEAIELSARCKETS